MDKRDTACTQPATKPLSSQAQGDSCRYDDVKKWHEHAAYLCAAHLICRIVVRLPSGEAHRHLWIVQLASEHDQEWLGCQVAEIRILVCTRYCNCNVDDRGWSSSHAVSHSCGDLRSRKAYACWLSPDTPHKQAHACMDGQAR